MSYQDNINDLSKMKASEFGDFNSSDLSLGDFAIVIAVKLDELTKQFTRIADVLEKREN